MRKGCFIIIVIPFILSSCKSDIKTIYSNRIEILQSFENITIGKRGKGVNITCYKDALTNDYLIVEKNVLFYEDTLAFINSSIQFNLKDLNKSFLVQDTDVKDYLQYCLKKMGEYKILSVNSEFKKIGISLELITNDFVILYIPDINAIKNSQWLSFVRSSTKLDENWYWMKYPVPEDKTISK